MWNKYLIIRGGSVAVTTIVFTATFILLVLYGISTRSLEYNCCNVTLQTNYTVSFEWPVPPYYNATIHLDHHNLITQIKCGYSAEDINGTFGAWYQGECLGNSCNIKDPYFLPILILTIITIISILSTIGICIQLKEPPMEYNRLD